MCGKEHITFEKRKKMKINLSKIEKDSVIMTLKITRIGNSKGVIIPRYILGFLHLDLNDLIEVNLKKYHKNED